MYTRINVMYYERKDANTKKRFYLRFGSDEGAREDPAIYGGDEVPPSL